MAKELKQNGAFDRISGQYCFYLEKSEQFGQYAPFMSKDTLKHYVKNYIQSHAGNVVEFAWQGGEPTLLGLDFYRQAVEYQQEFAQGKQITNAFQTNGISLNQQWAAFFKQHHFLIGLSIDGLSAVHNRYRISGNGNPTFEKVVKALNLLQEYGVEFNTLTVINDQNWQKGRETYLALKQLGSAYMQFIPIVECHAQTQSVTDFSVPSEGYGQFLVDVFHEWYEHDVGKIYVSQFDNLLGQWLGIVLSSKQQQFGLEKSQKLTALCRHCEFRKLCYGGCPKHRFVSLENEPNPHNYLCASYRYFFEQTAPYMQAMARQIRLHPSAA
ncbi:MAG: radical SAM protein [Haemophilus parainfluenzae]|nr:radical SAM protein [Haemophilus parainfluenzae]